MIMTKCGRNWKNYLLELFIAVTKGRVHKKKKIRKFPLFPFQIYLCLQKVCHLRASADLNVFPHCWQGYESPSK